MDPLDTATWQKVRCYTRPLGGNVDRDLPAPTTDTWGEPARTDELFPGHDTDALVITPSNVLGNGAGDGPAGETGAASADNRGPSGSAADHGEPALVPALGEDDAAALVALAHRAAGVAEMAGFGGGGGLVGGRGVGSNNWVISGERTTSGKPISPTTCTSASGCRRSGS